MTDQGAKLPSQTMSGVGTLWACPKYLNSGGGSGQPQPALVSRPYDGIRRAPGPISDRRSFGLIFSGKIMKPLLGR